MKLPVSVLLLLLSVITLSSSTSAQAPPPQDVKGWHGTTWGMTLQQVTTAIGQSLGDPMSADLTKQHYRGTRAARAAADFTVIKEYDVDKVPVGDWMAEAQFLFGDSGRTGLTGVVIILKAVEFARVRDEMKAQYGAPTSDNSLRLPGTASVFSNTWIFSSTEINLTWTDPAGSVLIYSRHSAL